MELWSDESRRWERVYSVVLVLVLLVIPLLLMLIAYSLISSTLWEAMHVSTQSGKIMGLNPSQVKLEVRSTSA